MLTLNLFYIIIVNNNIIINMGISLISIIFLIIFAHFINAIYIIPFYDQKLKEPNFSKCTTYQSIFFIIHKR